MRIKMRLLRRGLVANVGGRCHSGLESTVTGTPWFRMKRHSYINNYNNSKQVREESAGNKGNTTHAVSMDTSVAL